MRKVLLRGCPLLLLALCLPARPVFADPVVVGDLRVTGAAISGVGGVSRDGVRVSIADSGFVEAGLCFPCEVGQTTSFTGLFVGSSGSIELFSDNFTLPDLAASGAYTIVMPFTFRATRVGEFPDPPFEFSGAGTVTGRFLTQAWVDERGMRTLFNFRTADYAFGDTPAAATPEPASLLLIGSGLAGLLMRRRRSARGQY